MKGASGTDTSNVVPLIIALRVPICVIDPQLILLVFNWGQVQNGVATSCEGAQMCVCVCVCVHKGLKGIAQSHPPPPPSPPPNNGIE